jgi:tRNA pseudouridine13 synthase
MIQTDLKALPFEIKSVQRHRNKIKIGHVAGNRFKILLSQTSPQALVQAQRIGRFLLERGVPNFYGEQRFGHAMRNLDRAAHLLDRHHWENKRSRGYPDKFIVSALQSALFNIWLKRRIERGDAHRIIVGDLVQKCDTGGLFTVEDADEVQIRFNQHAVVYTGPVFGYKMMPTVSRAAECEIEVLKAFDLEPQAFKPLCAAGTRRAALLFLDDLQISSQDNGLLFGFTLTSGAYATTVMREFMRC